MIRKAERRDLSRIAEIQVFNYRLYFYPIFQSDEYYFNELQVPSLMQEYGSQLDSLYVYDDGVVKEAAGDNLLAVVDLFDINGPEDTEFPATVTIKNRKVDNFVAMVQYVNGEWKFVNAHVDNGLVVATIDQFGEFAILGTLEEASSAQTGESMPYSYLIGAVILAGAAVWFFSKSRKVKA